MNINFISTTKKATRAKVTGSVSLYASRCVRNYVIRTHYGSRVENASWCSISGFSGSSEAREICGH